MFFSKKNTLIPNVAEKNILILVEEKKNDSTRERPKGGNMSHVIYFRFAAT